MQVTILGLNGPYPAPGGSCSGYLVQTAGAAIQLDLGSGVLSRLTERMPPEELTGLCFSHWHGDHCSDLLPLIYRLADAARSRGERWRPLPVYGPEDPTSPVWREAQACPLMAMHPVTPGMTFVLGDTSVTAYAAAHPVPAVMYRLQAGGKILAYTGDTNQTEELPALAQGADLLLADGLFPRRLWTADKPHLAAAMCGETARASGAHRLVVTHLHPAHDPAELLREAQEAFPTAELARQGMRIAL